MKIFLSWSGERSKSVAVALRDWLPMLLQNTAPWLSDRDIGAGERWALEIGKRLEDSSFGIICLTRENVEAPWLLFEAGALSKALATSSVCPYLLDVDFQEVTGPLSQFQAKKADSASTRELVCTINQKAPSPLPQQRVDELYELLWPKLESKLSAVPEPGGPTPKLRSESEILEDLVASVRHLEHRIPPLISRIPRAGGSEATVSFYLTSDEIDPEREIVSQVETPGELITTVARTLGVRPEGFGSDWYLADPGNQHRITSRDELQRHFERAPRVLHLMHTRIPF